MLHEVEGIQKLQKKNQPLCDLLGEGDQNPIKTRQHIKPLEQVPAEWFR